ncbi:Kelch repeat-containing protein [Dokdonella sp.]|uniref:Kelch repeat-containing protein n=1 Tax=Dokdonella sp. TaxID=2291710 RepID=UPI003783F769
MFLPVADMTFSRYASAGALLNSGTVVLYGPSYDGDAYDPVAGTWSATAPIPSPRFNGHLFALPDGDALLVGGDPTDARTVRYVSETRSWAWGPALHASRRFEQAAALADGRILVAGGFGADAAPTNSAEIYDPATGAFTATGSMPRPRAGGSAELLADGRVLIAGGIDATGNADPCATVYAPTTGAFTAGGCFAAATHGRFMPAAARLHDGRVIVLGGQTYFLGSTRLAPDADVYDPATNRWTQRLAAARFEHALTTLDDGRVLAIGGVDDWNSPIETTEIFDPVLDAFRVGPPLIVPRYGHTATALPGGRVLVAGGRISASEWTTSAEVFLSDALFSADFE